MFMASVPAVDLLQRNFLLRHVLERTKSLYQKYTIQRSIEGYLMSVVTLLPIKKEVETYQETNECLENDLENRVSLSGEESVKFQIYLSVCFKRFSTLTVHRKRVKLTEQIKLPSASLKPCLHDVFAYRAHDSD